MSTKPGGVSVIIPTYAREELLCRCVADVLRQRHPRVETIVMDQTVRHDPDTDAYLSRVGGQIRHVRLSRPSVTAACNEGARLASGAVLVFLDDDIRIPDQDFLRRHEACYDDATVGVVAGRVRDPKRPEGGQYDPRSADPVWGWYHTGWDHEIRADVVTAPGANMSCRRDLFLKLGGFDERFTGNAFRFENDLCLRVRKAGYRVVFEPSAAVLHYYDSPGGHDNRHLYGTSEESHAWYASFFRNMAYITSKHAPLTAWPQVYWKLWRQHVLNRPYLRVGLGFVARRHLVLFRGVRQGLQAWRAMKQHVSSG